MESLQPYEIDILGVTKSNTIEYKLSDNYSIEIIA